jgi:uncharacterized membrane protein
MEERLIMLASSDATVTPNASRHVADLALKAASVLWFLAASAGLILFAFYIAAFYGPSTLAGDIEAWDRNKRLIHGYVAGDRWGNVAFGVHVLLAAILTFGGVLQLIPQIRARAIAFHRWNGRVVLAIAFVASVAALFLLSVRGGGGFDPLAVTLNAALILTFGACALVYARARNIDAHRRWALRTFMVLNGVWFLRVGVNCFAFVYVGLLNRPREAVGVFFDFWSYGSFLFPLAMLELYFYARDRGGAAVKAGAALSIVVLTMAMAAGSAVAFLNLWAPLIFGA